MSSNTQTGTTTRTTPAMQAVRALFHLAAIVIVTVWGFLDWELPFPGIFVGIGALALSLLVWALFLSPRPVLRTDRFGQALIELLLLAGAVGALLTLGAPWWIAAPFGLIGAVLGYFASAKR